MQEKEQNQQQTTERRRGPLFFQLIIVFGVLAVVLFVFGQTVLAPEYESGVVPSKLGELKLVSSTEGAEALADVSQLHGLNIELVNAYIGSYAASGQRVTVWVGQAESDIAAAKLLDDMVASIGSDNPAFANLRTLSIAEGYHTHRVFQVDGPGGQHFFYISKLSADKITWLTVEAGEALSILEQALNTF